MTQTHELTNENIIAHLKRYQNTSYVPHFTCGGDREKKRSCRKVLVPTEKDGKVFLVCPDSPECPWTQKFRVNHPVMKIDFDNLDAKNAEFEKATASVRALFLQRGFYAFTCSEIERRILEKYPGAVPWQKTTDEHQKEVWLPLLYHIECIRQMDTFSLEQALKASRFIGFILAHARILDIVKEGEMDRLIDVDRDHGTHLPRQKEIPPSQDESDKS